MRGNGTASYSKRDYMGKVPNVARPPVHARTRVGHGMAHGADPRQPLPIALPAAPAPSQRGMKSPIIEGTQHLFHDPPRLPSVAQRVEMVLNDIDWSAPAITIWVPGTSEYWIKQRFLTAIQKLKPALRPTMIPYEATWRFSTSVPDGAAVLRGVLEQIKRRAPHTPVLLAGESQGAWIISQVMTDPAIARIVTRASLWGHPAAAPQRFGRPGQVREVNAAGDLVTMDLGPEMPQVLAGVELLSRKKFARGLEKLASYAAHHPDVLMRLLKFWSFAIPFVGKPTDNAHDYDDDIPLGAEFLVRGL